VTTLEENELLTRIEGDAPMGRLMRGNYWAPFALSAHLAPGEAPMPVRLYGEHYVAFRAEDGRVGLLDELCPHRRASLLLARTEGNGVRCIYHGWKIDAGGSVVECPTQAARAAQFAARVPVVHFPVHEAGGLAWAWMGGTDAPPFPTLPFADEDLYRYWCVSPVPCNWLQGLEGSLDSVHVAMLHQTWIALSVGMEEHANLSHALAQAAPSYETTPTAYGLRAAALRKTADGRSYVRVTEHMMPFVTITPVGSTEPRAGAVFVISPVDDTHHLLFFGTVGPTPHSAVPLDQLKMQDPAYAPAPDDYAGLRGDRWSRWGQDRVLMASGHFTGFGRSLLEEDVAIQASMGPIVDRSKEHLSSSDVAVAHLRRMLLDALHGAGAGQLPPGSALSPGGARLPNASELFVGAGERWEDAALDRLTT
jgi:phenylpropionate dioxygenase-like ring-hydroxylating dioxygenase large terminal subunit